VRASPLSFDVERVRSALVITCGNITRAADALGVTKPYAMWLVGHHALREWARGLREAAGMAATGRPRKASQ
jgi:hypothetical protein